VETPQLDIVTGLTGRSFTVASFSMAAKAAVPSTTFLTNQTQQTSVNLSECVTLLQQNIAGYFTAQTSPFLFVQTFKNL